MSTLFSPIREFFKKGDILLLTLCLAASGFGLVLIFSATQYFGEMRWTRFILVQFIAICLGVVAYMLLTFVDFQLFVEKRWKLLLAFNIVFILLLLTPLGEDYDSGNLNWLVISRIIPKFPMDVQPNEIVKISFILMLALQIVKIQDHGQNISSIPSIIQIGGHTVFMLGLIAAVCGDFGMCVIYMMIFVAMAWVAGIKLRWFGGESCWRRSLSGCFSCRRPAGGTITGSCASGWYLTTAWTSVERAGSRPAPASPSVPASSLARVT